MVGDLSVHVSSEGVHSGDASGIIPDSFRVLRHVLSRLEDPETGRYVSFLIHAYFSILPEALHAEIPAARRTQTEATVALIGDEVLLDLFSAWFASFLC